MSKLQAVCLKYVQYIAVSPRRRVPVQSGWATISSADSNENLTCSADVDCPLFLERDVAVESKCHLNAGLQTKFNSQPLNR